MRDSFTKLGEVFQNATLKESIIAISRTPRKSHIAAYSPKRLAPNF